MIVKALQIRLGEIIVGNLFQLGAVNSSPRFRFVAEDAFAREEASQCLSLSMTPPPGVEPVAFWSDRTAPRFNGRIVGAETELPAFFQGLLPEGVYQRHIAEIRNCEPSDHFEILGACGLDLPGKVYAVPVNLDEATFAGVIAGTGGNIEFEVDPAPMEEGVSLSGVQPKLGVIKEGGRYVARTRNHDTHIIAKLPVVNQPNLPELEKLSLEMARVAGVNTCNAELVPLSQLQVQHNYDLGDVDTQTMILAVERFDRSPARRIHAEDFGQILGIWPRDKYRPSYLHIARVMMAVPSLGDSAVYELLRRILVNQMLGNPDMHAKNIGVIYPGDGKDAILSPAYDVVAYAAYNTRVGHALHIIPPGGDGAAKPRMRAPAEGEALPGKPALTKDMLRVFCNELGLPEKVASRALNECVKHACGQWPAMIKSASLTEMQKERLLAHFDAHSRIKF